MIIPNSLMSSITAWMKISIFKEQYKWLMILSNIRVYCAISILSNNLKEIKQNTAEYSSNIVQLFNQSIKKIHKFQNKKEIIKSLLEERLETKALTKLCKYFWVSFAQEDMHLINKDGNLFFLF